LGVEVDLLAASRVRSLERHVLDEMADAVQAPALVAAAGAHEHADADALQVRQGDGDDADAVAEGDDVRVGVVRRTPHRRAPRDASSAERTSRSTGLTKWWSKPASTVRRRSSSR